MIAWILIAVILVLSICQRRGTDRSAAISFFVPTAILYMIWDYIPGSICYHVCAIADLFLILFLVRFKTKLSFSLSKALFISILLNLFGFVMWATYQPPEPYYYSFILYYIWISFLLVSRGKIDWIFWRESLGSSLYSFVHGKG